MTKVRFVGDPDHLAAWFGDLCEWADQITICTARFDWGDGQVPFRRLFAKETIDKVQSFVVTKGDESPTELKRFHDRGVLRYVVEQRSRFRPNIYLFRKADEVRALVGTVRLTTGSFRSDLEATMLVEGSWHDEFACELSAFIDRCLKSARVSLAEDFQEGNPDAFLTTDDRDSRAQIVWEQLLGLGPLDKDSSVREAAKLLRGEGLIDFKRLDSAGPLYEAILEAIERGARIGIFDRPTRGFIRAILVSPDDFPEWLWERCLLMAMHEQNMGRGEAIRAAAEWASSNVGLAFQRIPSGGRIEVGFKRAITRCIRKGQIDRFGPDIIRRATAPIANGRQE